MKPKKLGRPCWEKTNIPKAIAATAQVDATQIDYFLASHTPIDGITNDNTRKVYSEEDFFQELFSSAQGEVLALVHGDPGTGKSHLIHWLKLRCEDALRVKEKKNIIPVLVQRRGGSLRDALEQIVQQLPEGFSKYLTRINEAIGRISETTARLKLANAIFLELSADQRKHRHRAELPSSLRDLPDICTSPGFRDWLCRDGGIIDRNIKRLDKGSDIEERESEAYPYFMEAEFNPPTRYIGNNAPKVRELIEEFDEFEDLRDDAATFFNEVLPDALREMTGLSDAGLREIFDKIRADLKKEGKELALFIEDISVMSALDEEVFVAVEPQARGDLCRMIAVLGLTNQGWDRLPDNQKQRVTHPVHVGGTANDLWRQDPQRVVEFSARYLNTVRLDTKDVAEVAKQLRKGIGISISACAECPVRRECHSTFGAVTIDDVVIGTFPFTATAPQRLLHYLDRHATTRPNPRGLLSTILRPVLDAGHEQLEIGSFPSVDLPVTLPEPNFWSAFEQSFCGGWGRDDKNRLKFFVQGWIGSQSVDETATAVEGFRESLGFPEFTKVPLPKTPGARREPEVVSPSPVRVEPDRAKLDQTLTNLRKWADGDDLVNDADIRNMLVKLFRWSISWDTERYPPLDVWKKRVMDAGSKPFRIEGMRSNPVGVNLYFHFPRNEETRALFEALAQFEYAGKGSWNFPHAEIHKRNIYGWLRRHTDSMISLLQPPPPLGSEVPVKNVVQLLALAATLRRRTRLPVEPQNADELVQEVLADSSENDAPNAVGEELQLLVSDLFQRHRELKRLGISELSSPQGRKGDREGPVFVDPTPIIATTRKFVESLKFEALDQDYFEGHLATRYDALIVSDSYSRLTEIIKHEREAIENKLDAIVFEMRAIGINTEDLSAAVIEFCSEVVKLNELARKANIVVIDREFEDLVKQNVFTARRDVWATALRQASELRSSENLERILLFDPTRLMDFHRTLGIVSAYAEKIERDADKILDGFDAEGDPDLLMTGIIDSLETIKVASFNGDGEGATTDAKNYRSQ